MGGAAKSVAKKATGAAAGGVAGNILLGPAGAVVGAASGGNIGGPLGDAGDKLFGGAGSVAGTFTGDNAAAAAREQDSRFDKAIEEAKKLEVTNDVKNTSNQTTQTTFDPRTGVENELLNASINNFNQQQNLASDFESGIRDREGLQSGARDSLGGILSGDAFNVSQGEQARIDALTGAQLSQGESRVNRILDERLGQLNADAAQRGVRGQAFSQLQTGLVSEAADQLTEQQLAANVTGANLALELPGNRVGLQAQTAGGLAAFGDDAKQQAIQNREGLQNINALNQIRDERLKGGKTSTTGSSTTSSTQKGGGVANILAAKAGSAGPQAARDAAVGQTVNTAGGIAGAIFGGG